MKFQSKHLLFLLILTLVNSLMAQNLAVCVKPQSLGAGIDQTISLNIAVENVSNLAGFQFDIYYNTEIIHATSATLGDFLTSTGKSSIEIGPEINNNNNPGKLIFGGATFGAGAGPTGNGILANIEFVAQAEGFSIVDLQNVLLSDIYGQSITIDSLSNGEIIVHSEQSEIRITDTNGAMQRFDLKQNYPNPFNPETSIEYFLPRASDVEITVFNLSGQRITTLLKKYQNVGFFELKWNGRNEKAEPVVSGIYVYQFKAGEFTAAKKMMLLR
jgi:hypothetical protein